MKANEILAKAIRVVDKLDKEGKNIPLLCLSHPGFGKTSTVRLYCDVMDYNLVTIIPSQYSSDDVLGLQSVDQKTGRLVRLTPSWFNQLEDLMKNGKRTVLFIDEITTCDPYIQGPLLDLIFSRNLGEKKLPDNIFIISAGNYSTDLNNEFKMSAPLINRFLLLNLQDADYNIREIINDSIGTLKTKEEKSKFLGLDKEINESERYYDYNKFAKWITDSKEVRYGKTLAEEVEGYGLLGFTSVRSISYAMKFSDLYMSTYKDKDWIRIAGDTLGTSNKRDTGKSGTGIPMRNVIESSIEDFRMIDANTEMSFEEICEEIKKAGPDVTLLKKAKEYVENHPGDHLICMELFGGLNSYFTPEILEDNEKSGLIRDILNYLTAGIN